MRRAAPAFEILMLAPVRRFFPEPRQRLNGGWLPLHGSCTPPRISPSCLHYVPLWLDRCTMIDWQGLRKTACQSCFWMDGNRSSPSWAIIIQKICTGGLRASAKSLFHFWLIHLMSFSRWICTFQAARWGLKKIPSYGRQRERAFYAVLIIFSKNFLSVKFSEKFCTVFHIPSVLNQTV